jgi:hypothetical protein
MDDTKNIFNHATKIIGLITILSGIFGVSYQKGMIIAMNLGNLNGNYDVREIFNSAVLGYLEIFSRISEQDFFDLMAFNWIIVIPFLWIGIIIPLLNRNRDNLEQYRKNIKHRSKDFLKNVLKSYFWSPLIGAITGFFVNFVVAALSYTLLVILSLSLLPALIGYIVGERKIQAIMETPPCQEINSGRLNQEYIRQCTHLNINGVEIRGDILLENSDAYFLHLDSSFLYVQKDGKVCASSKYVRTNSIQHPLTFRFKKDQTDSICNSIRPK